jgi:hypothetical protein
VLSYAGKIGVTVLFMRARIGPATFKEYGLGQKEPTVNRAFETKPVRFLVGGRGGRGKWLERPAGARDSFFAIVER